MSDMKQERYDELTSDLMEIHEVVDTHLAGCVSDERLWWTMESIYRVCVFIDQIPKEVKIAVLDSPEYLAEANQGMIDWSESVEPSGGWPKELLARLQ